MASSVVLARLSGATHNGAMLLHPDAVRLDGRTAVVTGAAQGIGEATARALAAFGADVALCDLQEQRLREVADSIAATGRTCRHRAFDVRDSDGVEAWAAEVAAELGPVDIVVNNAGGGFHAEFDAVSKKGEEVLVAENFGTVTNCVRAFVPRMRDGGAIVNVTSVEAFHAAPGFGVYAAMKAAVQQFSQTLALELGGRGIRVNCVAPDMIPTPGDAGLAADAAAFIDGLHPTPLRRMGSPEECAAVIVFLASDLAAFVTGTTIPVDGGTVAAASWKVRHDGSFGL